MRKMHKMSKVPKMPKVKILTDHCNLPDYQF